MELKNIFLVGLGGGLGSIVRYFVSFVIGQKNFPLATLLINIIGSFIIGWVLGISLKNETFATNWKIFLTVGVCGGFTTFSAFSLENIQLLQNEKYFLFTAYITASIVLGILAAWLGLKISL